MDISIFSAIHYFLGFECLVHVPIVLNCIVGCGWWILDVLLSCAHTYVRAHQDLAMLTADANGSPLILATDPDADRLALAERNSTTKKWKIFSGNELGTLLSWWAFKNYKERHPNFDGRTL